MRDRFVVGWVRRFGFRRVRIEFQCELQIRRLVPGKRHRVDAGIARRAVATVAASNGILAMVDGDLATVPEDATILICAGLNVQRHTDKRLVAWLRKVARKGVSIGAVCTGAHILAEDNHARITSHLGFERAAGGEVVGNPDGHGRHFPVWLANER